MRVFTLGLLLIPLNFIVGETGYFSRAATPIWVRQQKLTIPSPDGNKAIIVVPPKRHSAEWMDTVFVRVNGHDFKTEFGSFVNAEVRWASDSKAFFLTYSDGGAVGTYHVEVVYVEESGLRVIEPVPDGRVLSAPRCFDKEWPNVAAIRWVTQDSSRLVIAVEVPPHGSCASMGTFQAFEITVPEVQVKNRYDQLKAKKLFRGDIGPELRNAEDNCIRKPETCVPNGLSETQ